MGMMEWIGGGLPQDVPLSLATPGKLLYASTWARLGCAFMAARLYPPANVTPLDLDLSRELAHRHLGPDAFSL
jgi:hypothetical protein